MRDSESFEKLSFEEKYKLNEILDKEEISLLERYVKDLEEEVISLRGRNDKLESDQEDAAQTISELEQALNDECKFYCPLKNLCSEIVNEQYKYSTLKYDNVNSIKQDIDKVLTYEV